MTNVVALIPLATCLARGDTLTALTIAFVGLASFVSHLFENHKHGMPGLGLSPQTSYLLNRLDVVGCILVAVRLIYLYVTSHGPQLRFLDMLYLGLAYGLLRISEYDKYNASLKWSHYVWAHCLWHILIFMMLDRFLRVYIFMN